MDFKSQTRRPLSPAVLHILIALSHEAMHGYGIMKEVERQSARKYRLGPGTLYDNLNKLLASGLVEDFDGDKDDSRRKYRLTSAGAEVLEAELGELHSMLRLGRKRLRELKEIEAS